LDQIVVRFVQEAVKDPPSREKLNLAIIDYQQQLLLDCFDFNSLNKYFNYVIRLLQWNSNSFQVFGISDINMLYQLFNENIFGVSEKFKNQMRNRFSDKRFPESDAYILERVKKAFAWFKEQFGLILNDIAEKLYVETDNKELGKRMNNALNNLKQEILVKSAAINSCENGFSLSSYLRFISNAEIEFTPGKKKKPKAPEYDESDIEHPELFKEIKEWRALKAKEKSIAPFMIFHQQVLIQIVVCLPDSKKALKKIKGVGKKTIENYGGEILGMVMAYKGKNHSDKIKLKE
jgi:superfamily II DNA helicase RecQ